jgi:hypothetical protein
MSLHRSYRRNKRHALAQVAESEPFSILADEAELEQMQVETFSKVNEMRPKQYVERSRNKTAEKTQAHSEK